MNAPSQTKLGADYKYSNIIEVTTGPGNDASRTGRSPKGWRIGILNGAIIALLVLCINIGTLVYASTRRNSSTDQSGDSGDGWDLTEPFKSEGRKTLYSGDCETVRNLNTGSHLIINILSTLLLAAGNYAMQCLSAPTRQDINLAHANRKWLDIGVLSARNLFKIGQNRAVLWFLLAASSLPLHLFYNSVVYSSSYTRDYVVFSGTAYMLRTNSTLFGIEYYQHDNGTVDTLYPDSAEANSLVTKYAAKDLHRLENEDCINAYATMFPTTRSSLVLISESNATSFAPPFEYSSESNTLASMNQGSGAHPFDWICNGNGSTPFNPNVNQPCMEAFNLIDPQDWRPFGQPVDYCLSEIIPEQCEFVFVPHIAAVVIVFNFAKILVLLYIFFVLRHRPLITIGDAISSFLSNPDTTTHNLCLMGSENLKLWTSERTPQSYVFSKKRWSSIASKTRWSVCLISFTAAIGLCVALLLDGIFGRSTSTKELMSIALGANDPRTYIYGWGLPSGGINGLLANVLVANLPQVILSVIYMTYNGLFTSFMLGREWDQYGHMRKGLRVSDSAQGSQRSTPVLQLPYFVSVPLLVVSGLLHWLCSQSIFVISLRMNEVDFGDTNMDDVREFITCGYSPRAIIGVIALGALMVAAISIVGRRKYRGIIPVAGSCSAAISAMCHPNASEHGEDLTLQPLLWGVMVREGRREDQNGIGHCTFSSQPVLRPEIGMLYAG